jgi:hypothetical protein
MLAQVRSAWATLTTPSGHRPQGTPVALSVAPIQQQEQLMTAGARPEATSDHAQGSGQDKPEHAEADKPTRKATPGRTGETTLEPDAPAVADGSEDPGAVLTVPDHPSEEERKRLATQSDR